MTTTITKKNYPVRYPDFGWIPVNSANRIQRISRTIGLTKIAEGVTSRCPTTTLQGGWYITDKLSHALCNAYENMALVQFNRFCKSPLQNGVALFQEDKTVELTPLCIFPAAEIRRLYFKLLADNLIQEYKSQLKPEIQAVLAGTAKTIGALHQRWYTVREENYAITRVMKAAISVHLNDLPMVHPTEKASILTFDYEATRGSQQESKYVLARVLSQVLDDSASHKPMLLDVLCNRYTHASMTCDVQPQRAWRDML